MSFLDQVLSATRERLEKERRAQPTDRLQELVSTMPAPPSFEAALRTAARPSIIAEIKRSSPSRCALAPEIQAADIAARYERGGAAALSVLTEPDYFGGSLEDLGSARAACSLPLLRKDFVIDEYQLLQARRAGASAVLLICAALPGGGLGELLERSAAFGLEALVEVHDEMELQRALAAGANLVGINNRDLETLVVDLATSRRLLPLLPPGVAGVSESGIRSRSEVEEMGRCGAVAALVGSSLVSSDDPEAAVRELAGRTA